MDILNLVRNPLPWYIAGPLIGLTVPLLLWLGNKSFGISSNLRHMCAMVPSRIPFFRYDWRSEGMWNLSFALGIVVGGLLASSMHSDATLAASTAHDLRAIGLEPDGKLAPMQLFSFAALSDWRHGLFLLIGGMFIGFGARYAGGCTSGHAITGLANMQLPSLVAVLGFFAGGLLATFVLLPLVLPFIL